MLYEVSWYENSRVKFTETFDNKQDAYEFMDVVRDWGWVEFREVKDGDQA